MREPRGSSLHQLQGEEGKQGLYREPVFIKPLMWQSLTRAMTMCTFRIHWDSGKAGHPQDARPHRGGVDPAIRARSPQGMTTEP